MAKDRVVQVRLSAEELARLDRAADGLGKTRSEILRMGIDDAEAGLLRLEMRRRNIHRLVRAAAEVPGDDVKSEGAVWDARGRRVR